MENKRRKLCLRSNTRLRQSFSSRICDDLCEHLLSFLSFEDKIRFECVSKQFRRSVYNKQNILKIDLYSKQNNNLCKLLQKTGNTSHLNTKAFESVLKKCKFINKIVINDYMNDSDSECVLQLITKYCNHLKEIKFCFEDISEESLRQFGQKCGKKLRFINLYDEHYKEKYKTLLRFCQNLVEVKAHYFSPLSLLVDKNVLFVPKLEKIHSRYTGNYTDNDIEVFKIFAKSLANTLKSLKIYSFNGLMNKIPEFKGLEELHLSLHLSEGLNNTTLTQHLKVIGIQCKQLKRFTLYVYDMNETLVYNIFNTISHYKQLQYLAIGLFNTLENDENICQIICKSLKECKNLTHLCLDYNIINDNFFKDIDLYLPQIKYLRIETKSQLTDISLHSLSKLKELQTIYIYGSFGLIQCFTHITDSGVCDVINNCNQIKSFNFKTRVNISHKTIEELIKLAKSRPKTQFKHYFNNICSEVFYSNNTYNAIDLKAFYEIPNNLLISS